MAKITKFDFTKSSLFSWNAN